MSTESTGVRSETHMNTKEAFYIYPWQWKHWQPAEATRTCFKGRKKGNGVLRNISNPGSTVSHPLFLVLLSGIDQQPVAKMMTQKKKMQDMTTCHLAKLTMLIWQSSAPGCQSSWEQQTKNGRCDHLLRQDRHESRAIFPTCWASQGCSGPLDTGIM